MKKATWSAQSHVIEEEEEEEDKGVLKIGLSSKSVDTKME
jgi:hypothetical protein